MSQQPHPASRSRTGRLIGVGAGVLVLLVAATGGGMAWAGRDAAEPTAPPTTTVTPPAQERPTPAGDAAPAQPVETFDRAAHSVDDPASIWVVVNKRRPLNPVDYRADDLVDVPVAHTWDPVLRQEASDAVVAMFAAAASEAGLSLASNSAYRGYSAQVRVYNAQVGAHGQATAEQSVARPGYSEHQTGLAIDIGAASGRCSLDACFADTAEGRWLAENAHRFGFVLRYPAGMTAVTGYEFEPWHFRYVGVELADEMREDGVATLEEFFGLPEAPGYE